MTGPSPTGELGNCERFLVGSENRQFESTEDDEFFAGSYTARSTAC